MEIPSFSEIEINMRHCLLLKADDLYFTLADPAGSRVRNEFLGIEVKGLADENLSEAEIASIDLARFAISDRVRLLFGMLERRQLSLHHEHRPDVEGLSAITDARWLPRPYEAAQWSCPPSCFR